MMYTEQELVAILKLTSEGKTLQEAKEEIVMTFKTTDVDKLILDLKKLVCEYFDVPSLFPISRETRHIMPMVVFAYLIADRIQNCREKSVHELFNQFTGRGRCAYLHYITLFESEAHLHDSREAYGDLLTNHFLNLKQKITGLDYTKKRILAIPKIKQSLASERFNKNKDEIIEDIEENFFTYEELNNKYFYMHDQKVVREFFKRDKPEYVKLIRRHTNTSINKVVTESRESFLRMIKKGCTFKELNDEFCIYYKNPTRLEEMLRKIEPRIYNIISEYEKNL